jgi:hypothetical protein
MDVRESDEPRGMGGSEGGEEIAMLEFLLLSLLNWCTFYYSVLYMMGKWMQRTQDLHLWHNKYFFFLEQRRRAACHFIKKRIKTVVESQVIRTGPDVEPVRPSVHWFTGPTVKNRLNRWFDCFRPDELNRPQVL